MNYRLELAVNDSVGDVTATNHFKAFLDSLYTLYNRSPYIYNHISNMIFLKVGRVLDVRWVASSYRAVQVIWKIFPGLYNASNDTTKDKKTQSKYIGLYKKLGSPQFVLDLALMCDILKELSYLSNQLQSHTITLLQADQFIKRTIRVIESFKTKDREHVLEAKEAQIIMLFKTINLTNNQKLICINPNQFITNACNNLHSRLLDNNENDTLILNNIQILNKNTWPIGVDIKHGESEIQQLARRFLLNTSVLVQGMRHFIHTNTMNEEIQELNILIKTLPVSTAECERGFSLMNIICSDLRSKLTTKNISNLMFINVNGPPLNIWNPTKYVGSWLLQHRSANDNRSRKVEPLEGSMEKKSLWNIL